MEATPNNNQDYLVVLPHKKMDKLPVPFSLKEGQEI
jgi:hypothetical protein